MQPGPTYVIACPHCGVLAMQHTAPTGNNFGTVYWSDGKQDAPLKPDYPVVTKCGHCFGIYWVEDARQLGELPFRTRDIPREWRKAQELTCLSVDDLNQALSAGLGDFPERERHLRIRLWWAINDMVRYLPVGKTPLAAEPGSQDYEQHRVMLVDNCVRLSELLDEERPEHLIMKAEIARELGQFSQARKLLQHVPDEYAWMARQLNELVTDGDSSVHRLFRPD